MEVRVLGPVTALDGPRELTLGGARQRAVLAWLALHAPRGCTVPSIVDAVWGDDPPASARNAVQVYVSGLRKALPRGCGPARVGDGYCLPAEVGVDAMGFREQVAAGGAALRAGEAARAEQLLGQALDRWTGEPLEGLSEAAFRETAAAGLLDSRSAALRDRAAALLLLGRAGEAATAAGLVVDRDPYDEHACALLATARYHEGRQQEALDLLRSLRRRLAEELGLDPGPEVVELERQVLAHEVPPPAPPGGARSDGEQDGAGNGEGADSPDRSLLPPLPSPFVGRADELDLLEDAVHRARLVTVVGLGGMGKTTLAVTLGHRLVDGGERVAFCELESETTAVTALERVCRRLGADPGDDPAEALRSLSTPRVLVLDNAEQVDGLADGLRTVLANPSLRVVVTSRRPLRLHGEVVVPLGPLALERTTDDVSSAARLLLSVTGAAGHPLRAGDVADAERVATLLDGIPLAIEIAGAHGAVLGLARLAGLLEAGRLSALDPGREVDRPERQSSLGVVLEATVAGLEPATRLVARALVVCDGWTTLDLLERVTGPEARVVEGVGVLCDCGLVEADGTGRFRVRTVVREYLRSTQPDLAGVERRLVNRAREVVERAALSLQGERAEDTVRELAADHEPLTGALSRAIERGWAADAAAVAVALNLYWLKSARLAEGRRWLEAAASVPGHRPVDAARLRVLVGTFLGYFGDGAGVPVLRAALTDAERAGAPVDRVLVNGWCSLAALHAFRGEAEPARAAARTAVERAAAGGDPMLVALARDAWAYVAAATGDHEAALEANLVCARDARAMGDRYLLASSLQAVVDNLVQLDRWEEAAELSDELYDVVRLLEPGPLLSQVLVSHALTRLGTGRVSEAKGCLVEGLRVIRDRFANALALADALMALAATLTVEGRDRDAARAWGASDAVFAREGVEPQSHLLPVLVRTRAELEARVPPRQLAAWLLAASDVDRVVESLVAVDDAPGRVAEGVVRSGQSTVQ